MTVVIGINAIFVGVESLPSDAGDSDIFLSVDGNLLHDGQNYLIDEGGD